MSDDGEAVFGLMNHADGDLGMRLTLAEARRFRESEWRRGRIVHVFKDGDELWEDEHE